MKTPNKKKGGITQFNPLETPGTQATASRSSTSMKNQKSPGTVMRELTHSLDNTSLNINEDSIMSESLRSGNNNQKKK
jgi:hypothetical protein